MNTQLKLLEVEEIRKQAQKKQRKTESSSHLWWKLSDEERELGLKGVRAIRNILQNTGSIEQNTLAKAS